MTSYANLRSEKSYIAALNDLAIVTVSGDDAEEFLSNQFSSDVKGLIPFHIQHSAWCDPKGRVLFLLQLCKAQDTFHCVVDSGLVEKFCQRLKMFVLRAAVKVEHQADSTALAMNLTKNEPGNAANAPTELYKYTHSESAHMDRYLTLIATQSLGDVINALKLPNDGDLWRRDEILLAHPSVAADASGAFLPQNLNLDLLDGVSFTKGCYPGQEIIARLKYRGKVKQRLCVLHAELSAADNEQIKPMSAVTIDGDETNKVGKTLTSQIYLNELFVSAVVNLEHFGTSEAFHIEGCEASLSLIPPPYNIDN